jgi:hypothetical protein
MGGSADDRFARITPRAATLALLRFAEVVAQYEQERGIVLTDVQQALIQDALRAIIRRECSPEGLTDAHG